LRRRRAVSYVVWRAARARRTRARNTPRLGPDEIEGGEVWIDDERDLHSVTSKLNIIPLS
jgi:hypothetical protein